MIHKKFYASFLPLVFGVVFAAGSVAPVALAQTAKSTPTAPTPKQAARMDNLVKRADQEITRRITNLSSLITRVQSTKKLPISEQGTLATAIQGQISDLNNLKTKIDADTDLTTLLADVQSIKKSYRIYALVIPQTTVIAAADRVMTLVDTMNTLGGKIQARLNATQSAGKNVTSLQATFSDFAAKVSDANTQAQAAVTAVFELTADNGNKTKMQSNASALKDARAKIRTAQQDLVTARKDIQTIVDGLRTLGDNSTSTPSTSVPTVSQ